MISDKLPDAGKHGVELGASGDAVQNLLPPNHAQRFEGIAFSSSGNLLGVATSDTDTVFLFRREANGLFEETPYCAISGGSSGLSYPHDVSFASLGNTELLAVAQRGGAIAIYEKNRTNDSYGPAPAFEISGPTTKLKFSDGVAFVPPDNDYLAACNLQAGSISFYRRISGSPVDFRLEPEFELMHRSFANPDGLAFSQCGRWLAVANQGNHSVSIFYHRRGILAKGKLKYGPEPVTIIKDPGLRHPHSLAFTPQTNHLIVTNAGANYFSVYKPMRRMFTMRSRQSPVLQKTVGPESVFKEVNARDKMEGGPKGVAIHESSLAVCSPEYGVKIFSFREY